MTERTTEEWLADLQAHGSRRAEALEALGQRLQRGLFFYLRNERSDLGDRTVEDLQQMAQDFAQDALLKILDNLSSFRGESQFITWASKVAARIAISELRRARYKDYSLEHLTLDGEVMLDIASLAGMSADSSHPESLAERSEVLAIIQDALENVLTERQRVVLAALVFDGVPIEEIARRLNTNRNALYKLVHDARLKLKRHMEARGLSLDYMLGLFGS